MSGLPLKYRVRLAFGTYSVGFTFLSPPMPRAYAQTLRERGYLELVDEPKEKTELPKRKKK